MFPNGILLAAFLCFPWLYATANMLLIWRPVQGSAQGPIASWYFGKSALALARPARPGRHLLSRSPHRASPGACLPLERPRLLVPAFLGGWTGTRHLIGGPVPAWMVSASVAASIMMLIPATIICINTLGTFSGRAVPPAPEVSFTIFGLVCFAGVVLQGAATPLISAVTHFSDYSIARECAGYLRLPKHGALWRILLCRAAPHGKGFLAGGRILAFLAFCLGSGNNVSVR